MGAIDNVTVDSNVLLGGGYTVYTGPAGNPVSNVKFTNNDIGLARYGDLAGGDHGSGFVWQNNHNFATDAHLLTGASKPAATTTAPADTSAVATTPPPKPANPIAPSAPNSHIYSGASDLPAATIATKEGDIGVSGTAGNDVIYLQGSAHVTAAGGGNDVIVAGPLKDWMSGQSGNDTFVFRLASNSTPGSEHDIINDFGFGSDKIDLHLLEANAHQALSWVGNSAFSGHAGELHAYNSGQSTFVEADTNGDKTSDFQIEMNKFSLYASHFIL
jgi:hypothetical protein